MSNLTQDRLKSLLKYDVITGKFTRLKGIKGFAEGSKVGTHHKESGYIYIGVDNKAYRAHRLAWFYMLGEWPKEIDHINCNRADNSWINLRRCNRSQNNINSKVREDNDSGYTGVSWDKKNNKWRAYINVDGKQRHLGRYKDKELAKAAYKMAAIFYYGEFAQ